MTAGKSCSENEHAASDPEERYKPPGPTALIRRCASTTMPAHKCEARLSAPPLASRLATCRFGRTKDVVTSGPTNMDLRCSIDHVLNSIMEKANFAHNATIISIKIEVKLARIKPEIPESPAKRGWGALVRQPGPVHTPFCADASAPAKRPLMGWTNFQGKRPSLRNTPFDKDRCRRLHGNPRSALAPLPPLRRHRNLG